ncbi:cell division protein FtsW [Candidatus Parcubacteria bacterium]|nr:cell division protein FtsW [Candidatus Parcubacteria bacterium]
MKSHRVDKPLLISILILAIGGFFIFSSASLGLLARTSGSSFSNVAFSQAFYGLFLGFVVFFITSHTPYKFWRKHALLLFFLSLIATACVFIPQISFLHGGARRWISIAGFSFQPSEFLKIGFIIYLAAWIASVKQGVKTFRFGLLPFLVLVAITGGLLLAQPDTDTFFVILLSGIAMYFVGGAQKKHIALMILIAIIGFATIIMMRPYVLSRIMTFVDPSRDSLGSSYQIQQSLIAIGSGGITGRGFGKSIQKFSFLPEPIGDSIFAVASEEFGFLGSIFIVGMFFFFAFRGLKIAARAPDMFGGLMAVGIVILIVSQSFINIASMLNVFPLSGITLPFISHGGTSLFMTLAGVGILLNISKFKKAD